MRGSRNCLELYDPALARKQQLIAERGPNYQPTAPSGGFRGFELSDEMRRKLADALARESSKLRLREEERRRRDPTYRPDAIDLSTANLLEFDKYVDYYAVLEVDQFASANEVKAAYKRLSLKLHPDKQTFASNAERARAAADFHCMTVAHQILGDLATRRAYDQARDQVDAGSEAGIADVGKVEKPPPTCVDVEISLEQLYRGCRKTVGFTRNEFAGAPCTTCVLRGRSAPA